MSVNHKAYVSHVSYFSGKLESYLRYKEIPHERVELNGGILRDVILPATGVMKMPAMQCPDGSWLKDTTPMIQYLDQQFPGHPVYPENPAERFLALLIEDYADEWMWRPAMYYRWQFRDSHQLRRHHIGEEFARGTPHPAFLLGWFMRWRQYFVFLHGDGIRSSNRAHVEGNYHRTLQELSNLLQDRPFLLGDRPTIIDIGFMGSMFRHYALDPYPAKIMLETAPAVYEWVARMWNARASRMTGNQMDDFSDPAWRPLFEDIAQEYLPYLDANARHWEAGDTRFDSMVKGVRYPNVRVIHYRVACRENLLKAWQELDDDAKQAVRDRTANTGLSTWLDNAQIIPAGLDEEFVMPLPNQYRPATGLYGLKLFFGTPWDRPSPGTPKKKQR